MEGTMATSNQELIDRLPSAQTVASRIVHEVHEKEEYVVLDDAVSGFLFANMKGPSPGRGHGIWDWVLSLVASLTWPFFRRRLDGMCADSRNRS